MRVNPPRLTVRAVVPFSKRRRVLTVRLAARVTLWFSRFALSVATEVARLAELEV